MHNIFLIRRRLGKDMGNLIAVRLVIGSGFLLAIGAGILFLMG